MSSINGSGPTRQVFIGKHRDLGQLTVKSINQQSEKLLKNISSEKTTWEQTERVNEKIENRTMGYAASLGCSYFVKKMQSETGPKKAAYAVAAFFTGLTSVALGLGSGGIIPAVLAYAGYRVAHERLADSAVNIKSTRDEMLIKDTLKTVNQELKSVEGKVTEEERNQIIKSVKDLKSDIKSKYQNITESASIYKKLNQTLAELERETDLPKERS